MQVGSGDVNNGEGKYFKLKKYLTFALGAELVFITIVLVMASLSGLLFERFPQLLLVIKEAMAGISQKVNDSTASGMTIKIFTNNLLIAITPLIIFSFQLLPTRLIKTLAIYMSFAVGLFIYVTNAVMVGLGFGMLAMHMKVSYITLILISMVHGTLELFAIAAGSLFALYYLNITGSKTTQWNGLLPDAQRLTFKLFPILTLILAVAALLEVYVSSPLAIKLIIR